MTLVGSIDVDRKPVEEFITEANRGVYYLPSFQRQYVWDEDDIKDLIDSILKNYPIGTIILWKPSNSFIDEIDPFSKPLIDTKDKSKEIYYVIDGQQRLTSLLLLFNDWKIERDGEVITRNPISYNPNNGKLYKSTKRGINLSDLVKAFYLFDADAIKEIDNRVSGDKKKGLRDKITRILRYRFPVYILKTYEENEETFSKMAEAFIRVNRYGIRIGNLELMLSFLAGKVNKELSHKIRKLYDELYEEFKIDLQPVIRFTFSELGLKQTQISKVEQFKSNVDAISKLGNAEIERRFEKCGYSFKTTVEFLKEYVGVTSSNLLPSQIPVVTLASYFYEKNIKSYKELDDEDIDNIVDWFVLVSFNGYYSSQTDTKLDSDMEAIKKARRFPFDSLLENMEKRRVRTKITCSDIEKGRNINVLKRQGRSHLFLLYLLLVRNEADNWSGYKLNAVNMDTLAKHHIFPKEYLQQNLDVDDPEEREVLINNLGNITFISKEINSEIGDDPPEKYMKKYRNAAKKHYIPSDETLWSIEQYETFLDYRVRELYAACKRHFRRITE